MRRRSYLVISMISMGFVMTLAQRGSAGELDAAKILDKADKAGYSKSSHMLIEQTIKTTSGDSRTFKIESWSKNGSEKSLMRYLAPAPSAGIGVLMLDHGDNIWAYFPDSDDLRKIASSARNSSVEGSDFSYEDMSMGQMSRRWKAVSAQEEDLDGTSCYKLEVAPKKSSPYKKALAWIDVKSYVPHRIEFYDKKGKHIKTLTMKGYKQVKGIWTPFSMVMKNHKKGSKTVIETKKVKYNLDLDDSKFTTKFLTLI